MFRLQPNIIKVLTSHPAHQIYGEFVVNQTRKVITLQKGLKQPFNS
jgi:hypothetical protein